MFTEPYLANVTVFAGNFAPRGWAFCQGQLMAISQNTALFSLIGTIYGGDGQTTFGLPDLRGRVAIHPDNSTIILGQLAGTENVTLLSSNMPLHTHTVTSITGGIPANSGTGNTNSPANAVPAKPAKNLYNTSADGFGMAVSSMTTNVPLAGGNGPVPIISPVLCMNYIIAIEGIYPSRN